MAAIGDARDGGQWGGALRYLSEELDTEFGAYFMNYHSRAQSSVLLLRLLQYTASSAFGPLAPLYIAGNSQYFIEYPEDIQLYGLSFSTTLPTGTAHGLVK